MKKLVSFLAACLILAGSVFAAENISVYIDGNPLNTVRAPYLESDRTMVPMRSIFESLGCAVDWDEAAQSVTSKRDGRVIIMSIGSKVMYVDGGAVELDVAPALVYDTTFVPLRAVSEALGCDVTWSDDTNSVFIVTSVKAEIPMYPEFEAVPDFGQIVGITPNPVLDDGKIYCYENADADDAEKYARVMESQGFAAFDAGEYVIYTKDNISVLAGFRGGIFRIVITNY